MSSADVQPSAWKRETIVVQVDVSPFQPWTKRIGSLAAADAGSAMPMTAAASAAGRNFFMENSSLRAHSPLRAQMTDRQALPGSVKGYAR